VAFAVCECTGGGERRVEERAGVDKLGEERVRGDTRVDDSDGDPGAGGEAVGSVEGSGQSCGAGNVGWPRRNRDRIAVGARRPLR